MADGHGVQEGFLVLADVSGYTSFLTGTELEHAQAIMEELTKLILDHARPPFKLVKLEGDAVFYYATREALPEGERVLEHIEACYFDFVSHLQDMKRATTCPCAACSAMQTLELKFFAHYGGYMIQRLAGTAEDLAGPDVILVHRLLKNSITEATGLPAYSFLTDACLERTGRPASIVPHSESYEHLGEVRGGVIDLRAVEQSMREARRVYVEAGEADVVYERVVHTTPEVLWSFNVDPSKRLQWQADLVGVENRRNASGRLGAGAEVHCAHGVYSMVLQILDWRPFRYFTARSDFRPAYKGPPCWVTLEFIPVDAERTRVSFRVRSLRRDWFTLQMMRLLGKHLIQKPQEASYDRLDKILAETARTDTALAESTAA